MKFKPVCFILFIFQTIGFAYIYNIYGWRPAAVAAFIAIAGIVSTYYDAKTQ